MSQVPALQQAIDELDDQIIELLARRFANARRIGETKRMQDLPPYDPERMRVQSERFVRGCIDRGLDAGMARLLIAVIGAQVLSERLELISSPPA